MERVQLATWTTCVIYTKKFGQYLASWERHQQTIHPPIVKVYPSNVLKIIGIVKHLWGGSFNFQNQQPITYIFIYSIEFFVIALLLLLLFYSNCQNRLGAAN